MTWSLEFFLSRKNGHVFFRTIIFELKYGHVTATMLFKKSHVTFVTEFDKGKVTWSKVISFSRKNIHVTFKATFTLNMYVF